MGTMVANAFSYDVWVNTDSVLIEEYASSSQFAVKANTDVSLPGLLPGLKLNTEAGFERAESEHTVINRFLEIGFVKMSRGNVTTFKPAQNSKVKDMKIVYTTIVYFDQEGREKYLAKNYPHEENHSLIITESGSIVDAKGKANPWVDLNGKHHMCKECLEEGKYCSLCLVDKNLENIQNSVSIVQYMDIAHYLMMAMGKVSKNEMKEVVEEVKLLADDYRILEIRTVRAVHDVKDYGTNLKEAAEEYVEEGDISEFFEEMRDITNIKDSIKRANEQHQEIKERVKNITSLANDQQKSFREISEEKKAKAKDILIPGKNVANFVRSHEKKWEIKIKGLDVGDATKTVAMAANATQASLFIFGGVLQETLLYPILFPVKMIISRFASTDSKEYKMMEIQFGDISKQMESVNVHLHEIIKNIAEIEINVANANKAEEKFMKKNNGKNVTDKADRGNRSEKLIERANCLIKSCEAYFQQLDNTSSMRSTIEAEIEEIED